MHGCTQGSAQECARHMQRIGVCKAQAAQGSAPVAHKRMQAVQGSARGSAQTVCRQRLGSAYRLHGH